MSIETTQKLPQYSSYIRFYTAAQKGPVSWRWPGGWQIYNLEDGLGWRIRYPDGTEYVSHMTRREALIQLYSGNSTCRNT